MTLLCVSAFSCGPVSDSEREFWEERERRQESERELLRLMTEANTVESAIELVKQSDAPDGYVGTVDVWLGRQRDAVEGDVLFPRWEGHRIGANRFEVRYTHTIIDYDYNIVRHGFTWEADTMLKIVTGPTKIDPAELEPPARRELPLEEPLRELEGFSLE